MGAIIKRMKARRKRRQQRKDMLMNARQDIKDKVAMAKLSKKEAKKLSKVYGDLDPEQLNAMNAVQPYIGGMQQELQEQGYPVDPDDPLQTVALYDSEILGNNNIPEDAINTMYLSPDEMFEDFTPQEREHLTDGAKNAIKSGLKGAVAGLADFIDSTKRRAKKGERLSETEKSVLQIDEQARGVAKSYALNKAGDWLKEMLPLIFLFIVILVVFKK